LAELKDLTLWHWRFFVDWHPRRNATERPRSWEVFGAALDDAMRWAGAVSPLVSVTADFSRLALARHSSVRFASQPWRRTDGLLRCLEARALLDGFYIENGCALEGPADADAVARLKEADWHRPEGGLPFLGGAVCLTAECPQATPDGDADDVAPGLLRAWRGTPTPQAEPVDLGFGRLAVPVGADEEAWVLLIRDEDEARRRAAHLLHRLMPPLLLARIKGRVIMEAFERDLLPKAFDQEAKLDATLQHVAGQRSRLVSLERTNDEIARLQAAFAETLSQCEEMAATLEANAANLERLLADPLVGGRTALDTLLAAPLRLGASQVGTDLRYLGITQTQADRMQRSIGTMAEVRAGRWNRRTTVVLGLFVAFAALQVFPELPLGWRIGLSMLLPLTIGLLMLGLGRRG
jgi:hypothetical protein